MAQDCIKIGPSTSSYVTIYQPDEDLTYSMETTYSADSTRTVSGAGHFTPLFTVQSWQYKATGIPVDKAAQILQLVTGKNFYLHSFCPYKGTWTDTYCYVGKNSMNIKTLKSGYEKLSELSFNMIGVNPL